LSANASPARWGPAWGGLSGASISVPRLDEFRRKIKTFYPV
jgi:hypothetical protein